MNQPNTSDLGNINTAFAAARMDEEQITGEDPERGIPCFSGEAWRNALSLFISFVPKPISLTRCNFKPGTQSITNPAICFRDTGTRAYCFTYLD